MPEKDFLQRDYARYRIERTKEDLEAAHLQAGQIQRNRFITQNIFGNCFPGMLQVKQNSIKKSRPHISERLEVILG